MTLFGFCVLGPFGRSYFIYFSRLWAHLLIKIIAQYWYRYLDRKLPGSDTKTATKKVYSSFDKPLILVRRLFSERYFVRRFTSDPVFSQAILDSIIFSPPYYLMFFAFMPILEGTCPRCLFLWILVLLIYF